MALTAPSFTVNFNLNTGKFAITDTTDYAGEGIATTDVDGFLVITGPAGSIYNNPPPGSGDIDPSVSTTNATKNIPTASGEYVRGEYTITYYIVVGGGVQPGTYSLEKTFNFVWEEPEVEITGEVNCAASSLTTTDETSYGSVSSTTSYTHVTSYPADARDQETGEAMDDVSAATLESIINPIHQGVFRVTVTTTKVFSVAASGDYDAFTITKTLTGRKDVTVSCLNLCDIKCGMKNLYDRYADLCGTDPKEAAKYKDRFNKVDGLVGVYLLAERCGDTTLMSSTMEEINEILGDCNCCEECEEEEGWIAGVGGSLSLNGVSGEQGEQGEQGAQGEQGEAGEDGADGAQLLYVSDGQATTSSTSYTDLDGISAPGLQIAAGRFANDGDGFELECTYLYNHVSGTDGANLQINVNDGVSSVSTLLNTLLTSGFNAVLVKITATRASTNSLKYQYEAELGTFGLAANYTAGSFTTSQKLVSGQLTASNAVLFANAIVIELNGKVSAGTNEIKRAYYKIKELNKV